MTKEELQAKMLAFVETQDGDSLDEWYGTNRDFAAGVLTHFADFLGVELVVPEYVPRKNKPEVNREELLKAMLPGIRELFGIEYQKAQERTQDNL